MLKVYNYVSCSLGGKTSVEISSDDCNKFLFDSVCDGICDVVYSECDNKILYKGSEKIKNYNLFHSKDFNMCGYTITVDIKTESNYFGITKEEDIFRQHNIFVTEIYNFIERIEK